MSLLDGLVSAYHFDSTWNDSSGNGHNGIPTGATFDSINRKLGSACAFFDSFDDSVRISDHADFNFGSEASVFTWVKGVSQQSKAVVGHWDSALLVRSWLFASGGPGANDKIRVSISKDGTSGVSSVKFYESSITVFDDTWRFCGFTFGSGTLKLYVDGSEDTSPTKLYDASVPSLYDSAIDLTIGALLSNNVPTNFIGALVDEMLLYNRVLTADEISQLYNGGNGRVIPSSTGNSMLMGI